MAYEAIKYEPTGDVTKLGGALRRLVSIPAAGVANIAGKTAAGIANVFADDRTPDQKYKDSVDAVQQRLGGGLGSSAGSKRIGVPTPAGTTPIVSFNMGNNTTQTPAVASVAQPISNVAASASTKPVILPSTIRGNAVVQNADGSGTITPRRAPTRKTPAPAINNPAPQANLTVSPITTEEDPNMKPAGERIASIAKGLTPEEIRNFSFAGSNGGIATNGDQTFVLPARSAKEDAAFQAQATQQQAVQNTQPITTLAQQPVDMSPGSQGEWEANQRLKNRISALSPDLKNMTMDDLVAYNKGVKALGITSQANYHDAAAKNFGDDNALKASELPSKIYQNNSSGFHNMVAGQMLGITEPAKATNLLAESIDKLDSLPGKKLETKARTRNLNSEADSRDFLTPTIATKNLADAAEQQARIKTLLAPASAKGALTEKDILDAAHTDAYKTAVELAKGSLVTDPVEKQKEFDKNYLNAKKSALITIQQMRGGGKQ